MRSFVLLIVVGLVSVGRAQTLPAPSSPPDLTKLHAFCVHDMVRMPRVGVPVVSPDGRRIVFTVRVWDPEANKVTTNLWVMNADWARLRQLTAAKNVSD